MSFIKIFGRKNRKQLFPVSPCVAELFAALGKEVSKGWSEENEESFWVSAACTTLRNKMYAILGSELCQEVWPSEPRIESALREALRYFTNSAIKDRNWATQSLARRLVNYGHEDDEVVSALNPWWSSFFYLNQLGMTTRQVQHELSSIGLLVPEHKPLFYAHFDEQIANPARTVRKDESSMWMSYLFGRSLRHGGEANLALELDVSATLQAMASCANPVIDPSALLEGFSVNDPEFPTLDELLAHFNGFTVQIGHSARAIQLAEMQGEDGGISNYFVIADGRKFADLARYLRLPVDEKSLLALGFL